MVVTVLPHILHGFRHHILTNTVIDVCLMSLTELEAPLYPVSFSVLHKKRPCLVETEGHINGELTDSLSHGPTRSNRNDTDVHTRPTLHQQPLPL